MLAYSWEDFAADARNIAAAVRASGRRFTGVYAVPRGGLALGLYLSHTLDLPLWIDGKAQCDPGVLVVDDNTVTGGTLAEFQSCSTAVLVHNPLGSAVKPTFHGRESLDWPVFPWEADSGVALKGAA